LGPNDLGAEMIRVNSIAPAVTRTYSLGSALSDASEEENLTHTPIRRQAGLRKSEVDPALARRR